MSIPESVSKNFGHVLTLVCAIFTTGMMYSDVRNRQMNSDSRTELIAAAITTLTAKVDYMDRNGTQSSARELRYEKDRMDELLTMARENQKLMMDMQIRGIQAKESRERWDQDIPNIASKLGVTPAPKK